VEFSPDTRPMQLIDHYERRLNYLRISITDRCNLRCVYCMPREGVAKLRHEDILTYEEILRLVRIAVGLGVEKIRITGGEPLVRKGVMGFFRRLVALPGIKDISLTTNGVYLRNKLEEFKAMGVRRVNISLDSLRPDRYKAITGYDGLEKVREAVEWAEKLQFEPIKINIVLIRGVNDDEVLDFANLTLERPYHVRFIECMPLGHHGKQRPLEYVSNALIKAQVATLGDLIPISKASYDGPARRFKLKGAAGEIGFISPRTEHFCRQCNRLRLKADGCLRPCLLSERELDLRAPMRRGATEDELEQIFLRAAFLKPWAHHLSAEDSYPLSSQMSSIGG